MKKLAIIGASYLQLPLVRKAREMGIETHCFAWQDGAVCKDEADFFYPISILDKQEILKQCSELQIDGISSIATDMAVPTICYVAEKLSLPSNSYQSALNSTDKTLMRNVFAGKVNIPRYFEVQSGDKLPEKLDYPLIVKPTDRSGSRGVAKIQNRHEAKDAIATAISESFSGRAIVEEFIEGYEVSVESISWKGRHYILAITDKITTGSPHFVELAHHQPSGLIQPIQQKIIEETRKALDCLKIVCGAAHSEFIITNEGKVYAIELGARMGGDFIGSHLVELSTGYDFLRGVVNIALGTFETPVIKDLGNAGVYFLSGETKHLLSYFRKKMPFEIEKEQHSPDLKKIINSNDRSGYLIYKSNERIYLT